MLASWKWSNRNLQTCSNIFAIHIKYGLILSFKRRIMHESLPLSHKTTLQIFYVWSVPFSLKCRTHNSWQLLFRSFYCVLILWLYCQTSRWSNFIYKYIKFICSENLFCRTDPLDALKLPCKYIISLLIRIFVTIW